MVANAACIGSGYCTGPVAAASACAATWQHQQARPLEPLVLSATDSPPYVRNALHTSDCKLYNPQPPRPTLLHCISCARIAQLVERGSHMLVHMGRCHQRPSQTRLRLKSRVTDVVPTSPMRSPLPALFFFVCRSRALAAAERLITSSSIRTE